MLLGSPRARSARPESKAAGLAESPGPAVRSSAGTGGHDFRIKCRVQEGRTTSKPGEHRLELFGSIADTC
jgi:hypothetical protein